LFHLLFPVIIVLALVIAGLFIYRLITLGSADAAWNSLRGTGSQWQQRFTAGQGQPTPPYYQPSQPQQPNYQQQTPYYQPSSQAGQPQQPTQSYGEGYQSSQPKAEETPYYQPSQQSSQETPYYQPRQTPPTQQ
jgi:hypothetical protein